MAITSPPIPHPTKQENNPGGSRSRPAKPIERIVVWNRPIGNVGARLVNFRFRFDNDHKPCAAGCRRIPPQPQLATSTRLSIPLIGAQAEYSQPDFPRGQRAIAKGYLASGWRCRRRKLPHRPISSSPPRQATFRPRAHDRLEHRYKMPQYTLGTISVSVSMRVPDVLQRCWFPRNAGHHRLPADKRTTDQKSNLAAYYRTIAQRCNRRGDTLAQHEKTGPRFRRSPSWPSLPPRGAGKRTSW